MCFYKDARFVVFLEFDIIKSVLLRYSVEVKVIWMFLGLKLICVLYGFVIWEVIFYNIVGDFFLYI